MKILVNGVSGRMGGAVARKIAQTDDAELCGGVDIAEPDFDLPYYDSLSKADCAPDVVIDFSHHSTAGALLDYCVSRKVPVVIATTGQTDSEIAMIHEAAKRIPVFFASNMSLGTALLARFVSTAVSILPDASVEIIETHHTKKLDSPSGTALMLADSAKAARADVKVNIHSIRMGNIVGIHEVVIGTSTQTLTLKHEAHDRSLFADGAIAAARFVCGKPAGLYTVKDII